MWPHKCNPTALAWHHLLMGGIMVRNLESGKPEEF